MTYSDLVWTLKPEVRCGERQPTDRTEQVNRFIEFVRSCGYELVVSDSGVSIEELIESFESILAAKDTNVLTKMEADEDATD